MSRFHFLLNLSHTYSVILLTLWKYCPQQQERNGEFAPVHGGVILLSNTTTTLQHLATTKATNTETGARPPHTQRAECQVSVTGGTYTTISRRPHISHACRDSLVDPAVLPLAVCVAQGPEKRDRRLNSDCCVYQGNMAGLQLSPLAHIFSALAQPS